MTDADEAPVDITRKNMGGKGGGGLTIRAKNRLRKHRTPYLTGMTLFSNTE